MADVAVPVISVVTTTYQTPAAVLARTWASLRAQTHTHWEWVVLDDSPDGDDATFRQLYGYLADDRFRVTVLRGVNCGSIGRVKRRAFMAAEGDVLVELDHDDELHPEALAAVAEAFTGDVGFVSSNWCEINPAGESCRYPAGWAFGYGSDYFDEALGVWVMRTPPVNPTTMRHIVSVPNHLRAWSAELYRSLGGHDPNLPVADDYELLVRTFLSGTMVNVDRCLYRQHINPQTAQRQRNAQIQAIVAEVASRYGAAIDARAAELGVGP